MKDTLLLREYLDICDFSEMNAFHVHDEVKEVTAHPFVIYSQNNTGNCKLFVVISGCLYRDAVPVYLFQKSLCACLQQ